MLIDTKSALWSYLDEHLQGLILDGEALLDDVKIHNIKISDYSYLVFSFSKAYEGFLKRMFLDLKLIDRAQFFADEIRIGKILNPSFTHEQDSVVRKIAKREDLKELFEHMWLVWKNARNLVFHYYPHNFRRLTLREAENLIGDIIEVMNNASKVIL